MFRLPVLATSLVLLACFVSAEPGSAARPSGTDKSATPPPTDAAKPGPLAELSDGEVVDLPAVDGHLPRPDTFLGYSLGTHFTHWDRIQAYFDGLAASTSRVKVWQYGETYEGRPLKLLAVSSAENIAKLDEIRTQHQRLAEGLAAGERERLADQLPVVVWLAYGVHGNEPSSSEAAMLVAWTLAAGNDAETMDLLKHTVILIDPLVNPDGRERYVHSFEEREGESANLHQTAAEHFEPWPGGRQNHYLIDLNRDWAWASQQESRQRIAQYKAWEPQVYVDFHEMGSDSSYFFPPPAEPVHPKLDRRLVGWLDTFGRANAVAFDHRGWSYFKSENYDLFYPGYGDSYPTLRGAVGMTYEMAGGGRGGVAIGRPDGSILTLSDRIARHFTTSVATVKTAAHNGKKLLNDFAAYRAKGAGEIARHYLWSADQPESRALAELLAFHGIKVLELSRPAEIEARPLMADKRGHRSASASVETDAAIEPREAPPLGRHFGAGTFVASSAQPLGTLLEVLMDPDAPMGSAFLERQRQRFERNQNAEFYDITAWALPLAFNLSVWESKDEPRDLQPLSAVSSGIHGDGALGYLVRPQGLASYRLEAALRREHVAHRVALASFSDGSQSYSSGTLFIPRHGNAENLAVRVAALTKECGVSADAIDSSYEVHGISLGSSQMAAVRPLRVGLLSGEGTDATSFGFLWSLLDRQIALNPDRLDLARLRPADLAQYDVLVFPNGDYERTVPERLQKAVDTWVQAGGLLVGIGGDTFRWLRSHEMTTIKPWKAAEPDAESEGSTDKALGERAIMTPGAVVGTRLQAGHPLALGLASAPPVLVEGSTVLLATGDPRKDVLVANNEDPVVAGFAWPEAKRRLAGSLLVSFESRGTGSVVLFAQDPDFRLFWRGTTPLLLNAVLYGTSSGLASRSE
jgi:hypothetical protein